MIAHVYVKKDMSHKLTLKQNLIIYKRTKTKFIKFIRD